MDAITGALPNTASEAEIEKFPKKSIGTGSDKRAPARLILSIPQLRCGGYSLAFSSRG